MFKSLTLALAIGAMTLAGPAAAETSKDGLDAFNRGDFAMALRVMRPLAEQGDAIAMVTLGTMYEHGFGVRQDVVEAVRWYQRAVDQDATPTPVSEPAADQKRLIVKH